MKTEIVGNFDIVTSNPTHVLEKIFWRGHAAGFDSHIAEGTIPQCRIGMDGKGISIIALEKQGYGNKNCWVEWYRYGYQTRAVHDPHSVNPIHVFAHPSPGMAKTPVEISQDIVELCKYQFGQSQKTLAEIRTAIFKR